MSNRHFIYTECCFDKYFLYLLLYFTVTGGFGNVLATALLVDINDFVNT